MGRMRRTRITAVVLVGIKVMTNTTDKLTEINRLSIILSDVRHRFDQLGYPVLAEHIESISSELVFEVEQILSKGAIVTKKRSAT